MVRVAILSTYPPRPCGIGTFSADLRRALLGADPDGKVGVVAIVRDPHQVQAREVLTTVRQDVPADYGAVPAALIDHGSDVVLIEHEFGIFGGESGAYLLPLAAELPVPYVVTLHTVLSVPSDEQRAIIRQLCEGAAAVTVFTQTAKRLISESGLVPADKIRIVPHGAPAALMGVRAPGPWAVKTGPWKGRIVLSTFGLISQGKGIETAISALPEIVKRHPEVVYVVAGQTHPEVVRSEGERYRLELERQVRDLGLVGHVRFIDRFLDDEDLAELLSATDLYVTPYRSREQIVSGALTFAVAAGCPVVSTPYLYAEDLLTDGAGTLVPFNDPAAISRAVLDYLDDPAALAAAAAASRQVGAPMDWPSVGSNTLEVLRETVARPERVPRPEHLGPIASSPPVRTDHLLTLVDDVGIVQHASGTVPNLDTGYCVDDVARLAIVALELGRGASEPVFARIVTRALAFLRYAFAEDAGMHNFMSYARTWTDEPSVGDHVGRTVWALGAVVAAHPPRVIARNSEVFLDQLCDLLAATPDLSPRTSAYAILGLTRPESRFLPPTAHRLLPELAGRLAAFQSTSIDAEWAWFEDSLFYDNARLPQALLAAGRRLHDESLCQLGLDRLTWLAGQSRIDGPHVQLVGHLWRRVDGQDSPGAAGPGEGDEQPLDAAALVEALVEAFRVTGQRRWADQAVLVFEWFLGRNRAGRPLYDFASGGTHDGLSASTVNDNEGAESTLAFFQALLSLEGAGLLASLPDPKTGLVPR